ncbi:TetR/AcrR family transcriptional regulator [Mariniblastus fucicola]|uniref:HTH-type transcriptional regulator RutR n=1 Tax=Mariniblastus fucicola TaxID=980251 RepID=A0A5B9PAV4_9BACT|nr:TetR/AcrR family transcriptional regulator [Mariniblastus fucicola]QEG23414.1 HTH-type transcriptional regulator RutR [Mariniblastus fucicola]
MATQKKKTWKRARNPEQKAERVDAILEAAGVLLEADGLDGTGLNAIARQAGLSKPNLYVYFESREAILLRLLLNEVSLWSKSLKKKLEQVDEPGDVDAVAQAFADSLARRRRFCVLFGAMASTLEHNVEFETVVEFKKEFLAIVQPAVVALATAMPPISEDDALEILALLVMSAVGMWPHCHPSPVVKSVLAQPEFSSRKLDFKASTFDLASNYLRGFMSSL